MHSFASHLQRRTGGVINNISSRLAKKGICIVIEHNTINPLTKKSILLCPFDDDAEMLSLGEARNLMKDDFTTLKSRFIVFFPKQIEKLRFLEKGLGWLPIGAQYLIVGEK